MRDHKNTPQIRFNGFNDEWVQHDLGELIDIRSAARVHKEQWTKNGVPFFRTSDVVSIYKGQENAKAFISYDVYEELTGKIGKVASGDLLVTGGGSIGIPFLVPDDEPLYFKDADLLWFKNDKKFDGYFLYTFLFSETFKKYIKSISHTGTIAHYTIEQAKATPINTCDKEEQAQVGNYFQKLDSLIKQHQQKHDKLSNIKKSMLEKMFPKQGETIPEIRLKGFSGDWDEVKLGSIAKIKGRLGWKSLRQEEYLNYGPAMIAGKHIDNGIIKWKEVDHIPYWRYVESPEIMLRNGDVIFSKDGSLGNPAIVSDLQCEATINSTMMLVRPTSKLKPKFFYQVLQTKIFRDLIKEKVSGSSIPHLFQADMKLFTFKTPDPVEQEAIGSYFQKLDALINHHQQQITKLNNIKQACLSKMFV